MLALNLFTKKLAQKAIDSTEWEESTKLYSKSFFNAAVNIVSIVALAHFGLIGAPGIAIFGTIALISLSRGLTEAEEQDDFYPDLP